ncbi:unnamed protein product [Parnassius apollo]|uniref:(apollo) hypothetical protein n=1 Tax=Parnassius apollo TaxID=110799 RepID=A0A8S3XBC7_PARAO|nr:unnamed protein product [Parnassius apollo]
MEVHYISHLVRKWFSWNWFSTASVPKFAGKTIQSPQPQVDDSPISPTPGTSAGSEISQPMMLEVQLDEDVLVLLGDAPKTETPMGPAIYKDIANRWQDILEKGVKESLLKNYLIPSNYDLLMAPALNSGIKAADRDHYKTRLYHQQQWLFKLPKPTSQGRQQIAAANVQHKARAAVNAAPAGGTAAGSQHFTPPAVNQVDDVSPDIDEVPFSGQLQYFDNK